MVWSMGKWVNDIPSAISEGMSCGVVYYVNDRGGNPDGRMYL
jgi:hypothetical protein